MLISVKQEPRESRNLEVLGEVLGEVEGLHADVDLAGVHQEVEVDLEIAVGSEIVVEAEPLGLSQEAGEDREEASAQGEVASEVASGEGDESIPQFACISRSSADETFGQNVVARDFEHNQFSAQDYFDSWELQFDSRFLTTTLYQ